MFVQLWQRTLHQVAVPPGRRAVLTVGSEVSLWQPLLLDWVRWMRRSLPDIALRVHVDVPQDLINQVASGLVDVAIMYAPQHRPGLKIDLLMEEKLVLVTTDPEARLLDGTDYVYMDWGPDFVLHHGMNFPGCRAGSLLRSRPTRAQLCPFGWRVRLLQDERGAASYSIRAASPRPETPQFSYPVYAVHSANCG